MTTREIIKNVAIFDGFSDSDAEEILSITRTLKFPDKSLIIQEGADGSSMYILIKGRVRVFKKTETQEEVFIAILESGSYFGELSLLDSMPRSANVLAVENCEILHLRKRDFDDLINRNLKIANIFYKNCLKETFYRFRNIINNFTFSQNILKETSETLNEINKDLNHAKEVQRYFINNELFTKPSNTLNGIRYSFVYKPCLDVGGDFLNISPLDTAVGITIADVVGHGITAAMATGVIKSAFSIFVEQFPDSPAKVMTAVNNHYHSIMSKYFATCYYALINTQKMTVTLAKGGHHHPLFWKESTCSLQTITAKGIGIGIMDGTKYSDETFPIEKGDKLLFYTDGILEQRNRKNEMFGTERLEQVFTNAVLEDIPDKLTYIKEQFHDFCGHSDFDDDITLLLVEI